eukprot:TRINITY_DN81565_c0_g1_i1.p1 TRINITY_DN81565_c0_g1~~TRINITY_DN81565_c0_g1_i1.p1  ORF type:complete len:265 (-),score=64.50 TRINITY_DN81565_c0_g1_i1:34-828(-)
MRFLRLASTQLARRYASTAPAPASKYAEIYESNFEQGQFPIPLHGGAHTSFAKLLWSYATSVEGKRYDLYVNEFARFEELTAKLGALWQYDYNLISAKEFASVNRGFIAVLAWMQQTNNLDSYDRVKAAYMEMYNEVNGAIQGTLTLAAAAKDKELEQIKAQVTPIVAKEYPSRKLQFNVVIDPTLIEGWKFDVGSLVLDNAVGLRKALDAKLGRAGAEDFTKMTVAPTIRPTLIPNVGLPVHKYRSVYQALAELDDIEARHGV